jgi:hypothetical protein
MVPIEIAFEGPGLRTRRSRQADLVGPGDDILTYKPDGRLRSGDTGGVLAPPVPLARSTSRVHSRTMLCPGSLIRPTRIDVHRRGQSDAHSFVARCISTRIMAPLRIVVNSLPCGMIEAIISFPFGNTILRARPSRSGWILEGQASPDAGRLGRPETAGGAGSRDRRPRLAEAAGEGPRIGYRPAGGWIRDCSMNRTAEKTLPSRREVGSARPIAGGRRGRPRCNDRCPAEYTPSPARVGCPCKRARPRDASPGPVSPSDCSPAVAFSHLGRDP